jgi:hypothetical protein
MIIVATSTVREVPRQGRLLTLLNRREISARRGLIVSGQQTTGKTTALKQLGRTHELMVRERYPARLADRIPVVYVTTPPKGSPRKLAMEFARFLGLPPVKRGYNTTDIADAVCQHGPVAMDALAAATGRSRRALAYALPELRTGALPRADPVLPGHVRRTVCWRCAARRDVFPYATVWQPAEACICPAHRIWLGSAAHPRHHRQYDIGGLPEILRAQQRHYRLARRHGRQAAIDAIAEAAHITALWARHGFYQDRRTPLIQALRGEVPLTGKLPASDPVTAVVTYPETVDLARVLAMPRWRNPAAAAAGGLQRFQSEVRSHTGIRYEREDSRYDPLFRWFQKRRERREPI